MLTTIGDVGFPHRLDPELVRWVEDVETRWDVRLHFHFVPSAPMQIFTLGTKRIVCLATDVSPHMALVKAEQVIAGDPVVHKGRYF